MSPMSNYFELFNLPLQLPVDQAALRTIYQDLQRQFHPDNFATYPEKERQAMLNQSANINHAYHILNDPIQSADYFLALHGNNQDPEKNILHDPTFLQEQFELREHLDIIKNIDSSHEKEMRLIAFRLQITRDYDDTYQKLLNAISESNWSLARKYLNNLRFLKKLQQDTEHSEDTLFDL